MTSDGQQQPLWQPSEEERERTEMWRFMRWAGERHRAGGVPFNDYDELWRWSVDELEAFWADIWEFCGVRASKRYERVLSSHEMPGARWFEGAERN
jgi:acetoacetyl-CoA synthetase